MTIQFAPTELLHQIFQYLPRSSLLSCATSCKTWKAPAIQLFYENVELSEKTKAIWLDIVHQGIGYNNNSKNIGLFAKRLTVNLAFSTTMTQQEFLDVLDYLPFVRVIDLDLSGYKLHYLAYLNKRSTGCVTYLEEINTGDLFTDFQMQQYFFCAYSFRNSLKKLTLRNPNTIYTVDGLSESGVSLLKKFENLSHVTIISGSDSLTDELAAILGKLSSCPKLESIIYQNDNIFPEEGEQDIYVIDSNSTNIITANSQQKLQILPAIILNCKLQNIELHIPKLNQQHLNNIINYFPSNLNTLTISMTDTDYHKWMDEHSKRFGLYLRCAKNFKLSISSQSRRRYSLGGRRTSATVLPSSCEVLSKHWSFVQSVIGNRRLFCQMHITFAKLGTRPDFAIERDQRKLVISYNLENPQDIERCLEEFSACYYSSAPQPSRTIDENSYITLNSLIVEVPASQNSFASGNKWCTDILRLVLSNKYSPQSIVIKDYSGSVSRELLINTMEKNNDTKSL